MKVEGVDGTVAVAGFGSGTSRRTHESDCRNHMPGSSES